MDRSLQTDLFARLKKDPRRPALGFFDPRKDFAWITREELLERAVRYAAGLAQQGLRPGDVCILVLPSAEPCALLVLASFLCGGIPLLVAPPLMQGLSTRLPETLTYVIRRTGAQLVICPETMGDLRDRLHGRKHSPRVLLGADDVANHAAKGLVLPTPAADDRAGLQLTSGTTGFPRICVWKQKNVLAALDGMAAAMKLSTDDVCFNWTPLYHDMGLVNNFLLCLTKGVPLAMLSPHDFIKKPALWLRGLSQTGATVTWSPNFGFAITAQRVRDDEVRDVRLDHVRAFWNAAERIHLETMVRFHERFALLGLRPDALRTNYGCAENVGGATFSDPDGSFVHERVNRYLLYNHGIAQPLPNANDPRPAVSVVGVGKPAPGMHVRILSRNRLPLPDGQVGEIALETPSRMAGYLGQARASQRALCGKHLRTGDLGYLRGQELFWVGRVRERINVRGRKLDPSDFEPILLNSPGLRPGCFAVFGVDDEAQGTQRVVLVSEVQEILAAPSHDLVKEIREQVFFSLGVELSDVVLVPAGSLAKTSSGKRRHRHIRQLYLDGKLDSLHISKSALAYH
jgi:acyl-CoA synthetase (AMP-forming)/AMP-acid ligase II